MKRFYYISDDLDDLEQIEHDLEAGGIARPQIYLLSNDDVGLDNHDVNRVASFLKTDVIHSGEIGAVLGLAVAGVILLVAHFSGIAAQVGWVPFVFLAIIGFGFATWEAGFIGMQAPNVHFTRFEKALAQGRHVLFVETDREDQKKTEKSFNTTSQVGARWHRGDTHPGADAVASQLGAVPELGADFSGPSEQARTITRLQSTATNREYRHITRRKR